MDYNSQSVRSKVSEYTQSRLGVLNHHKFMIYDSFMLRQVEFGIKKGRTESELK